MNDAAAVDAYLAALPAEQRELLGRLRARVKALVPEAEEFISYAMPAFRRDGRGFLWYAGWKRHCSVYPLTDAFIAAHADELAGYGRTKGSLHFSAAQPLSDALVDDLVRSRLADLDADR